jgi:hypothetical protein
MLSKHSPETLFIWRAAKNRRHFRSSFLVRQNRIKQLIYEGSDPSVLSGPFAGMKYLNEIVWGPIECKWLGTYEQELHPILDQILRTSYSVIIDVGSAEGYYSVGLARKFPAAQVYSYDVDPWARRQQRRLASLNGVSNVQIGRLCTSEYLTRHISGRTLLVCDIEGYEYGLLDPDRTPPLRRSDILVEVHEFDECGLTIQKGKDELVRRFSRSHAITVLSVLPRSASALDATVRARLTPQEVTDCMDEKRNPNQVWVWLEAGQI